MSNDLTANKVDLGDGILIEDKLRMSAVLWLENTLDMSITEYIDGIKPDSFRMKDIQPLLIALILQANPDITEDRAVELSLRVDVGQLGDTLGKVLSFAPKNSRKPRTRAKPETTPPNPASTGPASGSS